MPVISLDNLVEEIPGRRVHLIKVDVEGNEAEVFAGAGALLGGPEAPALLFESFEIAPVAQSLARLGYEVRHVHYSLGQGLEFPRLGEPFDNLYGAYEAPNYVALKPYGQFGTFLEISTRCKRRVRFARRVLAALA